MMEPGTELVFCCPTSPNDGKRVRYLGCPGYNIARDEYDVDFYDVELVDSGQRAGVHKRFLTEVE
jgi:hypothetical protein